jgi:hypothetical protein
MRSSLTHLVIALAVCALLLGGLGAWYAAIAAKSASVVSLARQIEVRTQTVNRLAMTRATLSELAEDEKVVQNYFVPETGVVSFIDGLELRGRTLGTTVSVLSVSAAGTAAKPALEFSLSVEGSFDAVMRTAGSIEYAPYAISVTKLAVTDQVKNWKANMTLLVGSRAAATTTLPTAP